MKRTVILAMASVLLGAIVLVTEVSGAQRGELRWGREPMPRAGVCFFEDTNFSGRYFCIPAGDDLPRMPRGMNDEISSFRILGNIEITVYRDVRFSGPSGRFSGDVRDLRREGWNDQISSVRVSNPLRGREIERERPLVRGRQSQPREGACFYRDVGFQGDYFCVERGTSYARLPAGFEDQISSIRVLNANGVMIFIDRDFRGEGRRIDSDVPDLRRGIWNDSISSIRVY